MSWARPGARGPSGRRFPRWRGPPRPPPEMAALTCVLVVSWITAFLKLSLESALPMVRPGCGQGRAGLSPQAAAPGAAANAMPVPAPADPAASLPPPVKPGLAAPGPPHPRPASLPPFLRPRLLLRQLSIPSSRPAASPLFPPPPVIRAPLRPFLLAFLAVPSIRSLYSPRPWSPQPLPHLQAEHGFSHFSFLAIPSSLSSLHLLFCSILCLIPASSFSAPISPLLSFSCPFSHSSARSLCPLELLRQAQAQ